MKDTNQIEVGDRVHVLSVCGNHRVPGRQPGTVVEVGKRLVVVEMDTGWRHRREGPVSNSVELAG